MSKEKWYQRLTWLVIAAVITVIVTVLLSPFADEIRGTLPTNANGNRTQTQPTPTWTSQYQPTPTPIATEVPLYPNYRGTLNQYSCSSVHQSTMDLQFTATQGTLAGTINYEDGFFYGGTLDPSSYKQGNFVHLVLNTTHGDVIIFTGYIQANSISGTYSWRGTTCGQWSVSPV